MNDQPYPGSVIAKHKLSTRSIVSNAWLIKCGGLHVFCDPNICIGGYLGSARAPMFVGFETNNRPCPLGQNLLLARRMVEAGVRFITVNGCAQLG